MVGERTCGWPRGGRKPPVVGKRTRGWPAGRPKPPVVGRRSPRCREDLSMTATATPGQDLEKREDLITLTIDDVEVSVPKGTLVIRAAELIGSEIPRFCDHPLLEPVGACRQCLVEIPDAGNGRPIPKPQASCTLDGPPAWWSRPRSPRRWPTRPSTGTWSSCWSTTRWTARSATRAASARCRTRRCPTARPRAGSTTSSGRTRSRSTSPPRCCSTASAACCAPAAPGSPSRSPATRSSR